MPRIANFPTIALPSLPVENFTHEQLSQTHPPNQCEKETIPKKNQCCICHSTKNKNDSSKLSHQHSRSVHVDSVPTQNTNPKQNLSIFNPLFIREFAFENDNATILSMIESIFSMAKPSYIHNCVILSPKGILFVNANNETNGREEVVVIFKAKQKISSVQLLSGAFPVDYMEEFDQKLVWFDFFLQFSCWWLVNAINFLLFVTLIVGRIDFLIPVISGMVIFLKLVGFLYTSLLLMSLVLWKDLNVVRAMLHLALEGFIFFLLVLLFSFSPSALMLFISVMLMLTLGLNQTVFRPTLCRLYPCIFNIHDVLNEQDASWNIRERKFKIKVCWFVFGFVGAIIAMTLWFRDRHSIVHPVYLKTRDAVQLRSEMTNNQKGINTL